MSRWQTGVAAVDAWEGTRADGLRLSDGSGIVVDLDGDGVIAL